MANPYESILRSIQTSAINAVEKNKPTGIYFGTVLKPDPLEIQVDQKIILKKEQLLKLKTPECKGAKGSCPDGAVNIWGYRIDDELKEGDKLALLRQQGGQLYLILGKVEQV